jgi:hypothetical protein
LTFPPFKARACFTVPEIFVYSTAAKAESVIAIYGRLKPPSLTVLPAFLRIL